MAMTNSTKKTTTKKTTTRKPRTFKTKTATNIELPNNPFVFEVLDVVSSQRSAAKKVEVLKKYEHDSLKSIFIWNFDDTVISLLPEGEVPYGDPNEQSVFEEKIEEFLENILEDKRDYLKKKESLKKLNYDNSWINVN